MTAVKSKLVVGAVMVSCFSVAAQPTPGTVLWTYDAGETVISSPALASDGAVYVGTYSGLQAITNNGSSASARWTFGVAVGVNDTGQASSPAVGSDGTIYFGGKDGNLYALNPGGSRKWTLQAAGAGGSPATALDNAIYFEGFGKLYSFTPGGTTNWSATIADCGNFSSPSIGPQGSIFIGSWEQRTLRAFGPDGTQKWIRDLIYSNPGDSAAIGENGTIYISAGPMYAFTPDGTNLWSAGGQSQFDGPPVIGRDGTIYVAGWGSHALYAVTADGSISWNALFSGSRVPSTAAAVDSQNMIYYCVSNSVWALNSQGQIQWAFTAAYQPLPGIYLANTSPAIGPDGTIYAALGTVLYAIYNTNKLADSAWPMYRQNARHTGKIEKPLLQQPQKRSDANFQFQLYAQLGQTQLIQTSTDLAAWISPTNVAVTNVPMDVVDLSASNFPSRFYRTVSQ